MFGTNELSWGDVVEGLRGLEGWVERREETKEGSVEFWYRIVEEGEEGRGEVGSGYVMRREGDEGRELNDEVHGMMGEPGSTTG